MFTDLDDSTRTMPFRVQGLHHGGMGLVPREVTRGSPSFSWLPFYHFWWRNPRPLLAGGWSGRTTFLLKEEPPRYEDGGCSSCGHLDGFHPLLHPRIPNLSLQLFLCVQIPLDWTLRHVCLQPPWRMTFLGSLDFNLGVSGQSPHMNWFALWCSGHGSTRVWSKEHPPLTGSRRVTSHQRLPSHWVPAAAPHVHY